MQGLAGGRRAALSLFLISFLSLFGELVFIRYVPSNIYLLSYYKNAVLIAVFLGLGAGFLTSNGRRSYIEYIPLATLLIICAVIYFNDYLRIDLDYASKDESIWPEFWANTRARGVPLFGVLAVSYLVIALYFVPIGQEVMRMMRPFRPLKAYSINIAGSLAGIVLFSAAGWLWTTPLVWFAVFLIPILWWSYARSSGNVFIINIFATVVSLFMLFSAAVGPEVWSPYSRIRIYPFSDSPEHGFISTTNGNPQVGCMNLDIAYSGPAGGLNLESKRIYEIPYGFLKPSRVLIAGAGAGNETAMALRHGADAVDAVEIDPAFIAIGRAMNPHRPFTDPRVRVHADDARAFFHRTSDRYDLIVIGFLDSQYHLTHMSNIRTENFVYTVESLERTRELLTRNGVLQLNYNAPKPQMRAKLYAMLKGVYGDDLFVLAPQRPVSGNISFIAGPGVRGMAKAPEGMELIGFKGDKNLSSATDDWPFLYLDHRKIPSEYWPMLLFIPVVSLVFVRGAVGRMSRFSPRYFLLGLGFMLLETKSITSFALLFGSTVTVVSVVLSSIFIAMLLANLIIHRLGLRKTALHYLLILLTLLLLYFLPMGLFIGLQWWTKLLISIVLVSLPLFFASIVFGVSFSKSASMDVDMGSNILGAVLGGMSEYASMAIGFKGLYILSFAAYLLAFLIDLKDGDL